MQEIVRFLMRTDSGKKKASCIHFIIDKALFHNYCLPGYEARFIRKTKINFTSYALHAQLPESGTFETILAYL